jgi:molybdopterin-guanine dinucleotide biosynthesis protein B
MQLKLQSSQRIVDEHDRIVMAEGRMALLEHIVATGSINQAAKRMNMSYKSAWSKIRSTETHLKIKIVSSNKATGTRLTEAGEALLHKYRQLKQKCMAVDDAVFEALFSNETAMKRSNWFSLGQQPPIVSFVGHSGSGKTTIVQRVIARLSNAGFKVAIIKHDVHGFEMDQPGKDSWRHKKAGAVATAVSSAERVGIVMDADHDHQPGELAPLFSWADLILTEGYKRGPHPKIEVFRPKATGDGSPVCIQDPELMALISDEKLSVDLPVFGTGAIDAIADFLKTFIQSHRNPVDVP